MEKLGPGIYLYFNFQKTEVSTTKNPVKHNMFKQEFLCSGTDQEIFHSGGTQISKLNPYVYNSLK